MLNCETLDGDQTKRFNVLLRFIVSPAWSYACHVEKAQNLMVGQALWGDMLKWSWITLKSNSSVCVVKHALGMKIQCTELLLFCRYRRFVSPGQSSPDGWSICETHETNAPPLEYKSTSSELWLHSQLDICGIILPIWWFTFNEVEVLSNILHLSNPKLSPSKSLSMLRWTKSLVQKG